MTSTPTTIAQAADKAREGLAAAAEALREDPQQKSLGTRQHVRHCLRGLFALGEAVRLAGGQFEYDAQELCQAVNACLDLHSQSATPCAKAQLGWQPEAWTGVRQSLLEAARTALGRLIHSITAPLSGLEDDIAKELASKAATHEAVPKACEHISQALAAFKGLDERGMHRVHLKLYNWLVDVYRNALAGFPEMLLPEALALVREDGRRVREMFTAAGVLESADMDARYELLKSSARAASLVARRKSRSPSVGTKKTSGHTTALTVDANSASLGASGDLPSPRSVFADAAAKGRLTGSPVKGTPLRTLATPLQSREVLPPGEETIALTRAGSVDKAIPAPRTPTARSWALGGLLRAASSKGPGDIPAPHRRSWDLTGARH